MVCAKDKLILAVDVPNTASALTLIEETHEYVGWYKIGLELIASQQAEKVIRWTRQFDCKTFFDAKINDIPTTVGRTVKAISPYVDLINVHAFCGIDAMKAAVDNAGDKCKILAVTVLTSLQVQDLAHLGIDLSGEFTDDDLIGDLVCDLAAAAFSAGVHGLVCSPKDIRYLQQQKLADKFIKVTPGVRPEWAATNDQKRVMTPGQALLAGSDMLVIGRPITNPPDGLTVREAAEKVYKEIDAVLNK